jgi:cyclophilin family peptidyl-prolyl cis-trans isomerase/HEAT repeat protein
MQTGNFRKALCTALLVAVSITTAAGQKISRADSATAIPTNTLLRIMRAEDERRWDENLAALIADKDARVRKRAALAAGRIGDVRAVPALVEALKTGTDQDVRQLAAFAIGEVESPAGAEALIAVLDDTREPAEVRARAVEALGKIGGALSSNAPAAANQAGGPKAEDPRLAKIRVAILDALKFEAGRRSMPDRSTVLLGLTAALRTKPEGAGPVIIQFLGYSDPRIVADALNTMARLRLKDGSDQVRQLLGNGDPIVRANAARVIGAAEDKQAFDALLARALNDNDLRVRVSAIRALGSLKDARATIPLMRRGSELFKTARLDRRNGSPRNEGLEILNALGVILAGKPQSTTGEEAAARIELSLRVRAMTNENILEDEVALAREAPEEYLEYLKGFEAARERTSDDELRKLFYGFRSMSARAAGLAELGRIKPQPPENIAKEAQSLLLRMLNDRRTPELAIPNILNAYAVFKPRDLPELLRRYIEHADVVARGTAADLIGEQPPDEVNARSLIQALPVALRDKDLNDAALSILDALAKQKSPAANDAIKTALDSSDHLIRRRAVALLKANGVGDFSNRIGTVKTRNTDADYRRATARIGRKVTATVVTTKGAFTIEFLTEEAPLTVDNFVQLARKGYFNGQTVPRVVPNFVIQTGDPRGDQNGGPGYQIRCEINEAQYERGAVGMALSGKDTGGSQWFVTHSPQPHLDGGYTVFGRVIRGMDVVDNIARGDTILRVIVNER